MLAVNALCLEAITTILLVAVVMEIHNYCVALSRLFLVSGLPKFASSNPLINLVTRLFWFRKIAREFKFCSRLVFLYL